MVNDSLGDRMKTYEKANGGDAYITPRMPVIIRVDMKAAHTLTRGMNKPFDRNFGICMDVTAETLCKEIQNAKIAYVQSDEISILLNDYERFNTCQWFGGKIQKITSISASITTASFLLKYLDLFCKNKYNETDISQFNKHINFDARVFSLPKEEINNYFVWRQKDWTRNSINMIGRSYFSHKQMENLSINDVKQKLLEEKNYCWEKDTTNYYKNGRCCFKTTTSEWLIDIMTPIFSQDPNYAEQYLQQMET